MEDEEFFGDNLSTEQRGIRIELVMDKKYVPLFSTDDNALGLEVAEEHTFSYMHLKGAVSLTTDVTTATKWVFFF